jgi:hypothetical protein
MRQKASSERPITITFPNGNQARAVHVPTGVEGAAIAAALGLPPPRAVLLISGGASDLSYAGMDRLHAMLSEGVARVAAEEGITIIDGGTRVSVFQMIGERVAASGSNAPLIGVCPAALVSWPGGSVGEPRVPLEPNHSHFVFTPGDRWGGETQTMFALADALSNGVPSLAILINGGPISRHEVLHNIRQKREVIVIRGSGRLADQIGAAWDAPDRVVNTELAKMAAYPGLILLDIGGSPAELASLIHSKLSGEHSD